MVVGLRCFLLLCCCFFGSVYPLEITQRDLYTKATRQAMPLLLGVMPEDDKDLWEIGRILAQNLERSGQFKVTLKGLKVPRTQSELNALFEKSYPLEIFLNHEEKGTSIGWRLYDAHDKRLIKGKKYLKRGKHVHGHADNIADELWPILTSQPSSFSSKVAYVKRKKIVGARQRSVICVAHSDGSHEQTIVPKLGTYVSLYWHNDTQNPCLFCSEFTRFNVRFASINMQGRKRTVLNLMGTCVGISVAHDNNNAVYCRSGNIWQYRYDPGQKKGIHKELITNDGKNVSPTLLDSGDIIFCSDSRSLRKGLSKARGPQIYRYNVQNSSIVALTQDGYCVGPSYCARTHKIAYSKRINGVMQLCIYDLRTKKGEQLTFDVGNKIDCCWSPCGNYIIFCYHHKHISRIAMLHIAMKKRTFITPASEHCSCPSWSPVYAEVPVVTR